MNFEAILEVLKSNSDIHLECRTKSPICPDQAKHLSFVAIALEPEPVSAQSLVCNITSEPRWFMVARAKCDTTGKITVQITEMPDEDTVNRIVRTFEMWRRVQARENVERN